MQKLHDLAEEFAELDAQERLELLVELSDQLPALSPARQSQRNDESCRVQECQTAVYLWLDVVDGRVHLEADVPKQSPMVRGLVAALVDAVNGAKTQDVLHMPDDLVEFLKLQSVLGMTRQHGMRGVVSRIKRETAARTASQQ